MKCDLSAIVQRRGYDNVRDFYSTYYEAKGEYADYMKEVEEWKKSLDGKLMNAANKRSQIEYECNLTEKQEVSQWTNGKSLDMKI